MILPVAVFVAVLAIVLGAYGLLVVRPEDEEQRKLKKRLRAGRKQHIRLAIIKGEEQLSTIPIVEALLARASTVVSPLRRMIQESGARITIGRFVLATLVAGVAPLFVTTILTGRLWAGVVVAACTVFVPLVWLRRVRANRLWRFEEQFPEGIDLIARALRAGHTFPTGLSMVADEMQPPVGTEFREIFDHQNFGMPLADALKAFAERVPLLDAKFFVTAVLTQREAGGNLAEVLDNLSSVIRERFKVKRQVRVISAHGRITGWILAALPPSLAVVFTFINPKLINTLFHDPLGQKLLMGATFLQVTGTLIIRKIINIEY